MNKIHTTFFIIGEAIAWPLYKTGACLREALIDAAIDETFRLGKATEDSVPWGKISVDGDFFVVDVYSEENPALACICGQCAEANHYFTCEGCGRSTPWCRGADDQYPDLCDDCAVAVKKGKR